MSKIKPLKIQSGNEQIEVKKEELICFDCKKKLKKTEEFIHYVREDKNFFKCKKCHEEEPLLYFQPCEVFSRVVGYIRPIQNWHPGKQAEFKDRKVFKYEIE